jgi:hypothetical protein
MEYLNGYHEHSCVERFGIIIHTFYWPNVTVVMVENGPCTIMTFDGMNTLYENLDEAIILLNELLGNLMD